MNKKFWSEYLKRRDHLRSPRLRCEDNIEMGFKEIGYEDVGWINVA
jgi:hypothetical protein